jgi:hypothetical protein
MIRIVTQTVPKKEDRDNPSRVTEVIFYGAGPFMPEGLPRRIIFQDKVPVEFRPYKRATTIVVQINMHEMMVNPQYRSVLRSLLGNRFGRFVQRRIRSHRRWNTSSERPYVKPRLFEAYVDHLILQVVVEAQQATQFAIAPQQTGQIATT